MHSLYEMLNIREWDWVAQDFMMMDTEFKDMTRFELQECVKVLKNEKESEIHKSKDLIIEKEETDRAHKKELDMV